MESTEGSAMAAKRPREWLWCEALCPICVQYFTDPVSLECGHSFCKACLLRSWEEMPKAVACVQCEYLISKRTFKPNEPLARLVEETKQAVEHAKEEVEGKGICETHQKILNYYCKDDQAAICELCRESEMHRSHKVTDRNKYKNQIKGYLNRVMMMRRDFYLNCNSNAEGKPQEWLKQTEVMRKKVVAEFKRLHQLLEDQEYMWMLDLVALEKTIVDSKKSYEAKAQSQICYVDEAYIEMEGRCLTGEKEFLQDFGKGLVRFDDRKLENPVTFPTELKTRIQTFCDRKFFLDNVLKTFSDEMALIMKGRGRKRFKRGLSEEQKGNRVQVILDQDTANIHLFLSQDLRTVEYRRYFDSLPEHSLPKRPRGFRFSPCVLGRQAFTSGRHYWEVKVCGLGRDWALGIARESVARDYDFRGPQKGVWVVGRCQRDLLCSRWLLAFALQEGTDDTVLILRQKPEKIRVCLDCSEGRVAFSNADTDEVIYSFSSAIIASERIHPFFWLDNEMALIMKGRGRKRFKRSLSEEQKGNRVEVILDQDTAHPHLWLSQDLKKMCYVKYIVPLLERPRGFKFSPCILGRQVFSSGRHYWNVKVCGLGREWALGIARESVARDDPPGPPDNGVWVVGKRRKDALYSRWLMAFALQEEDDDTVLILSQKPEKIRVCLDCSEGRVAFFNADTDEFIYSFSSPIISSERIRPFFWSFSESIEFLML